MKKLSILICLALLLAGCSSSDDSSESSSSTEELTQTTTIATEETSTQKFKNIDIEITTGTITIYAGAEFTLLYEDGEIAEYTISNDTLYIPDQSKGNIVLTLPSDYIYETIALSVGKGHLYAAPYLEMNNLYVDVDEGEVTLDILSVSDTTTVDVDKGAAVLYGTFNGDINATCNEGHITVLATNQEKAFNYDLTISNANILIGTTSYHSSTTQTIDNGASKTMILSCTRGNINIEF